MRNLNYLLTAIVLGALCPLVLPTAAATAGTIMFTHSGSGSGTLNGVAFPTSNFVITSLADTADKVYVGYGVYSMDHASSSIAIAGLGDLTILTGTRTFWDPGARRVGFSRGGSQGLDLLLGPENAAFASWDMISPIGPVTGPTAGLRQWRLSPQVNTTGGILIFNDGGGPATFSAVPEPATLGLLALGALALVRRRRT